MSRAPFVVLGCGKEKRRETYEHKLYLGHCTCDAGSVAQCDLHRPEEERTFRTITLRRSWPIVDLYVGRLYRARLAYARRLGGPHLVVSAFHGARRPDYVACPYDRCLTDLPRGSEERRWYDATVRSALLQHTLRGDRIVALASRPYVEGWVGDLRGRDRVIELPLQGLGMGQQLRWLRQHTEPEIRPEEPQERPLPGPSPAPPPVHPFIARLLEAVAGGAA